MMTTTIKTIILGVFLGGLSATLAESVQPKQAWQRPAYCDGVVETVKEAMDNGYIPHQEGEFIIAGCTKGPRNR